MADEMEVKKLQEQVQGGVEVTQEAIAEVWMMRQDHDMSFAILNGRLKASWMLTTKHTVHLTLPLRT